jgi:hypothetical protein
VEIYFKVHFVDTMTWQLKGWNNGARRNCALLGNDLTRIAAMDMRATRKEPLEMVFSM